MKFQKYPFAIVLMVFTFLSTFAQTDISRQWPQFHGYRGGGILDKANIPATWNL